ncbi:hypothetical protein [Actinokineospora sp.]|uniref:hypothetical protein n=1 Tax=Actinokineospora sp. TaxID=1872133 RepID=UPI0040378C38
MRAEVVGPDHGSLGARIRAARLVPYQAVIGANEAADDQVALRLRDGRRLPALPATDVLTSVNTLIEHTASTSGTPTRAATGSRSPCVPENVRRCLRVGRVGPLGRLPHDLVESALVRRRQRRALILRQRHEIPQERLHGRPPRRPFGQTGHVLAATDLPVPQRDQPLTGHRIVHMGHRVVEHATAQLPLGARPRPVVTGHDSGKT